MVVFVNKSIRKPSDLLGTSALLNRLVVFQIDQCSSDRAKFFIDIHYDRSSTSTLPPLSGSHSIHSDSFISETNPLFSSAGNLRWINRSPRKYELNAFEFEDDLYPKYRDRSLGAI